MANELDKIDPRGRFNLKYEADDFEAVLIEDGADKQHAEIQDKSEEESE